MGQGTFTNNANGGNIKLSAGNSIKITAKKLVNNQNLDLKGGFLDLSDQAGFGLINNALITSANSDLIITGAMQNNSAGILQSQQNHNIVLNSLAGEMINSGQIKTDDELHLSGKIINKNIIARIDDTNPLDAKDKEYLKIVINDGSLTNDISGKIITNNYLLIDGNNKSGSLNNYGIIRSNHLSDVNNFNDDDVINIKNINALNNSGIIDSAEDLDVSANQINNTNSGLLFAGLDATLNTNSLTNDNANIIASSGDIKIQKTNLDSQGNITEDYVKADQVNNLNGGQIKTLKSKVDAPLFNDDDVRRVLENYAQEMLSTNNFSAKELNRRLYALRGYLKNSDLSIEEQMNQGVSGNIKIHTNALKNDLRSIISSNNYIKINADQITNDHNSVLASANYFDIITNDLKNLNNSQIFGATVLNIKSDNADDLNNQIVNSGLIRGDSVYLNSAKIINNSSNQSLDLFGQEFASNDYSFIGNNLFIFNNEGNFLITINKNVAEATDNDGLLNDFLSKINAASNPKLLGDDIYLSNFIANLLQTQTSSRYLTFDATSDLAQLKSFLASTANQMQNLGIVFGSDLTNEQRSNLNAPFISFKKQEVFVKDGNIYNTQIAGSSPEEIYIPTILTPFATTQNQETSNIASQNASAIAARNELVIDATKEVRNSAQIKAGTIVIETQNFTNELSNQTLTLDANGNLTYVASNNTNNKTTPSITAKDNIFITAKNNFNNNSANISAGNNLIITAKNNFNVSGSSGFKSNFKAGNIVINAANANINHLDLGADNLVLGVDNNLSLQNSNITSNDIYLSNLQGFAKIDNSNINTNSSLNINAGGNVDILASNINASGLQISSANNLAINSSNINSSYLIASSGGNTNIDKANINSAALILDSGADLNIDKSNIKTTGGADGYLQISAKNNFSLNSSNIDSNNAANINVGGNANILASNIKANGLQISSGNNLAINGSNINSLGSTQIISGGSLGIAGSVINSSDYTAIAAKNDLNLTNSSLNAQGLILDSGADLNIDKSNLKTTGGENGLLQISSKNNFSLNNSKIDSNTASIINAGGNVDVLVSNIGAGDLQISSGKNVNIDKSNINSKGDAIISSVGNFAVNSSNLNAKSLVLDSGAGLNIDKSNLQTSGANGYLQISAKNDLNLNSSNIDSNIAVIASGNNLNLNDNKIDSNVTSISADKNINLLGNNINAVDTLQIAAGGDLNIATRQTTTDGSSSKTSGRTTKNINSVTTTHSGFNTLSGGNIALSSGGDTNIVGATLNANDVLQINAGGNLSIKSAFDTATTNTQSQTRMFKWWGRAFTQNSSETKTTTNKETATTLNAGNIYLNAGNELSITTAKINTNDLIATAQGQITFRQNQSKTTGMLALINERGMVNTSSTTQPKSASAQSSNPISSTANITYEAGQVQDSAGDLVLMTSADIINHGSLIAGGNINLQANNITNSKVSTTTNNGSGFTTRLSGEALIQAGGSVYMKATNDINNYAGTIIAGNGDITLLAGGNVNIGSMQERTYVHSVGKKYYYHYDQTTNVGSNLSAGNNIIIKAGNDATTQGNNAFGNINVTGSNLTSGTNATTSATNGANIIMNAANNLNIKSSVDSLYSSGTARKSSFSTSQTTNNKSNLIAGTNSTNGNIYINTLNINETTGAISIPTSLTAKDISNDVNIIGSNLKAKDNIAIAANNNINIASAQDTFNSVSNFKSKKRSSSTSISQTTQISSDLVAQNGSIELNAMGSSLGVGGTTNSGNINITASNLSAANNVSIIAANNLNIESAEDSYYYHTASSKKGSFDRKSSYSLTVEEITNKQSNIIAGGNLVASSGNNMNITASNLTTTTGDINLSAANNVNIVSAANTYLREEQSSKQGTTIMKASIDIKQDLINVASNLNAGNNIVINSGADTNLIGTKLTAANDIAISAAGELGIYAVADQHYRYQNSVKTRSFATIAKYTGVSFAMDFINHQMDLIDALSLGQVSPLTSITRGTVGYYQNLAEGDFSSKSQTKVTQDTIYQKANLAAGNNLSLIANNNINLVGVDLSAINNNITDGTSSNQSGNGTITSLNGDVAIINVKDSHQESLETHKSRTTLTSIVAGSVKNTFLIASTAITAVTILKNPFDKQATYKENEAAMKDTLKNESTHISQITDETIIASNLNFTGNLNISSGNNTNITSSNLNAGNNLNINSTNATTINTAAENDSTFTLTEKKSPNIFAAFSNGFVQLFAAAMPDFTFWEAKKGKEKEKAKTQRENDSLGHQAHRIDFDTRTADKSKAQAMIEGYTISNNDASEMAYDLDLNKTTTRTKTNIASNLSAGNNLNITSTNNDNLIIASNLAANNNINLNSLNGRTTITSAGNESFFANSNVDQKYNDISFSANRGRLAVNSNSKIYEEDTKTTTITQIASQLISGNNININAKDNIDILSSNLNSNNQINLTSTNGNINILANSNTVLSEKEIREATLTLSAGIGHVAVDAAYAGDDLVKANSALNDAKENLTRIKNLYAEGKAEKDAVDDAKLNVDIAKLNVVLAGIKLAAAVEKARGSTFTLGFYADASLTRTGDKTNINSSNIDEIGSNLFANNTINISSGLLLATNDLRLTTGEAGNTNIKGTIQSQNGDINITSRNDTNITALKSTSSSSTKSEGFTQTITIGASYGASAAQQAAESLMAQLSVRSSKSDNSNVNYTNTTLTAQNGNLKINSGNDTTIKGANLLSQDLTLNTQNNLTIESLQNSTHNKSKSRSIGGGGGSSFSLNYNSSRSSFDRNWVDNQTSIIGTNSVTINTKNNTNLKGALIANATNANETQNKAEWIDGNNLTMNTGSLTTQDIYDSEKQKSSSIGLGITINTSKAPPSQQNNSFPKGSINIALQNEGYIKEQTTKATIGNGTIKIGSTQTFNTDTTSENYGNLISANGGQTIEQLIQNPLTTNDQRLTTLNRDITKSQVITKDTITGALNINTTIDLRLLDITGEGQKQIFNQVKNLPGNLPLVPLGLILNIKDIATSFTDQDANNPDRNGYFKTLDDKMKNRVDAIFNTQKLTAAATDKNTKYFNDPKSDLKGYYNPETGETFINLAYANNNGSLQEIAIHETEHKNENYNLLNKDLEERLVSQYTDRTNDLISFYHNQPSQSNNDNIISGFMSGLVSLSLAHSGFRDEYLSANNHVNNLYNNSTANVSASQIIRNNFVAQNVDRGGVETWVKQIPGTNQYEYKQQVPGQPGVYRTGITTEAEGRYIDPAPKGLDAEQQISFINDNPKGGNPDQKVSFKLAETIEKVIGSTDYDININSTTGGKHGENSSHYVKNGARAADINRIDGVRVTDRSEINMLNIGNLGTLFLTNENINQVLSPVVNQNNPPRTTPYPQSLLDNHNNHLHINVTR